MRPILFAHLVTSGLGPVYDGIVHVLASPDDLIPVLAAGLLAGQHGPRAARVVLVALAAAWLAGGAMGAWLAAPAVPVPLAGGFVLLGLLIAIDRRLPTPALALLAAGVGLVHGSLNGADIVAEGRDPIALAGVACAVFVLTALSSAQVVSLTAQWSRVVVRAAGSWIAAIGLLMLGWSWRAL